MSQARLLARIADLAEAEHRRESARALAAELGAEELLVFIEDPELGHPLPAPGFPQTLPRGRQWQAFLSECKTRGQHCAVLPYPDPDSQREAVGTVISPGAIVVLCGGSLDLQRLSEHRDGLLLLVKLLHDERAARLAIGRAATAREAAAQATELASALDGARGELQDALNAADREIARRKEAEKQVAQLLAAEQERSRRLVQVADACQRITTAYSLESVLDVIVDQARRILGAHHAAGQLDFGQKPTRSLHAVSVSSKYAALDAGEAVRPGWVGRRACQQNRAIRWTRAEAATCGEWLESDGATPLDPPTQGCLAAPLVNHNGTLIGFVQLSDKEVGEFTGDDEVILAQLVNVATGAIENALLYDKLREADRRKDEFLAMLGHELRNPLAPLRSGLDLLSLERSASGDVVGLLQDQVNHIVRLVDDLLDVSRIIQGRVSLKREPVELQTVISQAVEAAKQLIEDRGQTLILTLPEQPLSLNADRTRLVQVIGNFLNNAAKYSEEGGRIELTAEAMEHGVRISVEDNGIGIEPELLPEIFELFTQSSRSLDRSQGGLGIGLTLAKQLVELHDGSVSAFSAGLGQGSRFEAYLPLGHALEADAEPLEVSSANVIRRILVVDDNVGAASMVSLLIRRMGAHQVETAHEGLSAIEKARRSHPDIILLDVGLPKMDGLAVARTLRQSRSFDQTLLVALTGYGQEEDRHKSLEAGFDEHLVKPIDYETLRQLFHHPKLGCRAPR